MSDPFVKTLMDHIMEATMIPKAQIERVVGPILSMFLADVLTETFKNDIDFSGTVEMICPEFPLKKTHNRQSTNIDWLMYHPDRKMLLFVELKTSDTSVNDAQNSIYRERQRMVSEQGGGFLVSDIEILRDASTESGKYQYILSERIEPFRKQIHECRAARLIYLVPEGAQHKVIGHADKVLTFKMLSDAISGPYAEEWKIIHGCLSALDEGSQRSRNLRVSGDPVQKAGRNYQEKYPFNAIVKLCKQRGDAVVVGFSGGRSALENRPLSELRGRLYKWDEVKGSRGKKDSRNWIPGSTFAWVIERKTARIADSELVSNQKREARSDNWAGTAKFNEMVKLCQQQGDTILIGFTGGRIAFANTTLDELKTRLFYRWDYANSTAKRNQVNWLTGGTVLELLRKHHGYNG